MIEKIESKVEDLKGLLSEVKSLNKALAKHGFELAVKSSSAKPKKRKAKKVLASEALPTVKKKPAKKKAAKIEDTDVEF